MQQHALINVNNFWNANSSFYLEASGGQNSHLYLNVHFFNTSVNGKQSTVNKSLDGSMYPG